MFNKDIATGQTEVAANSDYSTTGPATTFQIKNDVPATQPAPICYVWAPATCTDSQYNSLLDGTAVVHDYIVIGGTNTTNVTRSERKIRPVSVA